MTTALVEGSEIDSPTEAHMRRSGEPIRRCRRLSFAAATLRLADYLRRGATKKALPRLGRAAGARTRGRPSPARRLVDCRRWRDSSLPTGTGCPRLFARRRQASELSKMAKAVGVSVGTPSSSEGQRVRSATASASAGRRGTHRGQQAARAASCGAPAFQHDPAPRRGWGRAATESGRPPGDRSHAPSPCARVSRAL